MDTRHARVLGGSALLVSLLAGTFASSASAADCTLTAPTYINVGATLTVDGAGFPASTSVDIDLSIEGGASDAFSVQTDSAGGMQIALTLEDIDIGVTTVQATAGSICTASVTYTVLAAGATPPPDPTEEPASGTGSEPSVPSTDMYTGTGGGGGPMGLLWVLAFALLAAGSAGLYLTRSPRRR